MLLPGNLLPSQLCEIDRFGHQEKKLSGKKRSDNSDEFLIKKKNPLILPPDYEEMPIPVGEDNEIIKEQGNLKIKELVIDTQAESENDNSENSNLEKSILEKISD